jgi:hypothetical protein
MKMTLNEETNVLMVAASAFVGIGFAVAYLFFGIGR